MARFIRGDAPAYGGRFVNLGTPTYRWSLFFLSLGAALWLGCDLGPALVIASLVSPIVDTLRKLPRIVKEARGAQTKYSYQRDKPLMTHEQAERFAPFLRRELERRGIIKPDATSDDPNASQ